MPNATAPRIRAGEAYIRITADNSALIRGLDAAKEALRSFGQTLKGIGTDMMQLSGVIALPLALSAKEFADFDDKVRILKAITGAAAAETSALTKYMRELGATTAFTAEQVAQGGVELARMGFDISEVKDGLKPIMDLVRATGTETFRLGEVASYASATMRGFGLSSEQFAHVCDIMGVAADNSAMDIADLGEAMKIVAPSAKTINEDIKDTAASLMLMANAGVRGSLAGTSLRKVYQSLAAQSGKTAGLSPEQIQEGIRGVAELNSMGIALVDTNGNLRKTNEIMSEIAKKSRALKTGERINFATDIFDLRGSLGALSIMDKAASLDNFRKKLNEASGHNRKIAEDMEQGIGGALRLIISQFKELQISIGEAIWNTFGQKARNEIVSFISAIRNLVVENKELASKIVAGIGAVFAFGVALFGLGAAIKILANAFGIVSFAIKASVGVIMLAMNAYLALKNVVIATHTAMTAFGLFLGADASVAAWAGSLITLTGVFLGLIAVWKLVPGWIETLKRYFSSIVPIVTEAFTTIRDSLAAGDMQGALKVFVSSFKLAALKAILPLRQLWASIGPTWKDNWYGIIDWLKKSLVSLAAFAKKAAINVGYFLRSFFLKSWNGILEFMINGLASAAKVILDGLLYIFYGLGTLAEKIGLDDGSIRADAEYAIHNTNHTLDTWAEKGIQKYSADTSNVDRAWDSALAAVDKSEALTLEKISEETLEKRKRNNEAWDAEFLALQKQIEEAEKGAEEAKEFAAMFHVMKLQVADLKNYFESIVESYVLNDAMRQTISDYEAALHSEDPAERDRAEAAVREMIEYNRNLARQREMEFNEELEAAQEDRVIDDEEDARLRGFAESRAEALKMKAEYERLLASGYSDATAAVMDESKKVNGIGAWSSDVLNAMLNTPDEKRTADAAESINDAVLDIKRKIFSGKWGSLTYGA